MAEQNEKKEVPSRELPDRVRFHYIKSNYFRIVHVDGAYGGITPGGDISINFYSERNPIPQITAHIIKPDGRLGEEIPEEKITRNGIIREVEVGAVLDLSTAKALITWLQDKIEVIENIQSTKGQSV